MSNDPNVVKEAVKRPGKRLLLNTASMRHAINELSERVAAAEESMEYTRQIRRSVHKVQQSTKTAHQCDTCFGKALSGDIKILEVSDLAQSVAAADLNAAAEDAHKIVLNVAITTLTGVLKHFWYSGTPVFTGAEQCADAQIGAPTINHLFTSGGQVSFEVVPDTDAGATKTYAPGDTFTVDVQLNADDKFCNFPVPMLTFTVTCT